MVIETRLHHETRLQDYMVIETMITPRAPPKDYMVIETRLHHETRLQDYMVIETMITPRAPPKDYMVIETRTLMIMYVNTAK